MPKGQPAFTSETRCEYTKLTEGEYLRTLARLAWLWEPIEGLMVIAGSTPDPFIHEKGKPITALDKTGDLFNGTL